LTAGPPGGMAAAGHTVLVTARLSLAPLGHQDAAFICELLNETGFRRFVGDKGVRTIEEARTYIDVGPAASYAANGFGLLRVDTLDSGSPVGICGLVWRDGFDVPDLGFAVLERYWGLGYATEAAGAVLAHARSALGIGRLIAMADPGNAASLRVLEKLGCTPDGHARLPGEDHDVNVYRLPDRQDGTW